MLTWRARLEMQFHYDPNKPLDARDLAQIDHEVAAERARLEAKMLAATAELRQIHGSITSVRQHMKPQVEHAKRMFQQASADSSAIKA